MSVPAENQACPGLGAQAIIYRHCVPADAGAALDALYGSMYSSLSVLQSAPSWEPGQISTYMDWHEGKHSLHARSIFLFRQEGVRIRVVNEGMHLNQEAIHRFCEHLFAGDSNLESIDFHAIAVSAVSVVSSSRPWLQFACTEDIVVDLPGTGEDYLQQLGKSTRKSIKKHLSHACRALPGLAHSLHEGRHISEAAIRQIASFNHERMAQKARRSALDEKATHALIALLRRQGIAGVLGAGKRVLAGTLTCRFGDDVFSLVTAHDPAFDHLGLGSLSRHLMILAAIEAGAKRFHLLGGHLRSKRAALGVRQRLHHLAVYRSRSAMLRDTPRIAKLAADSAAYHLHSWAEYQEAYRQGTWPSLAITGLRALGRRWRRWRQRSEGGRLNPV